MDAFQNETYVIDQEISAERWLSSAQAADWDVKRTSDVGSDVCAAVAAAGMSAGCEHAWDCASDMQKAHLCILWSANILCKVLDAQFRP